MKSEDPQLLGTRMKVVIRTDSSVSIGYGHVMRCLSIAEELRILGAEVCFICRDLKGNLITDIKEKGYTVYSIAGTEQEMEFNGKADQKAVAEILEDMGEVDWIIIDHYQINQQWEKSVRPYAENIMVIDDLADRPHDCDVILDQGYYSNNEERYRDLVPVHSLRLFGPGYALLREEFKQARYQVRKREGSLRRIMIMFGGTDPTQETEKALSALELLMDEEMKVDVVTGEANERKELLREWCKRWPNMTFHCQVNYVADLMLKADLAIGAGGSSTWERCYLGLPAITILTAANQVAMCLELEKVNAIMNLGWYDQVSVEMIARKIKEFKQCPAQLAEISKQGLRLFNHNQKEQKEFDWVRRVFYEQG